MGLCWLSGISVTLIEETLGLTMVLVLIVMTAMLLATDEVTVAEPVELD